MSSYFRMTLLAQFGLGAQKSLHHQKLPTRSLQFSSTIDVVEFGLLSQYFGTHILTGSTYQLWALFLTTLKHVKVKLIPGIHDIGFVEHALSRSLIVTASKKFEILHLPFQPRKIIHFYDMELGRVPYSRRRSNTWI